MKYILIVPDGAADYPIEILGNRTPLEAADTPYMDALARNGIVGRIKTVPKGFSPSSDVANLALLGYDPEKYYCGRGPLEAANLGVQLKEEDVAFRCNLITESEGNLLDYSAGHIRDHETHILMKYINEKLGNDVVEFYAGKSYRNLMVYRNGVAKGFEALKCYPPHDIMGKAIKDHLPKGESSQEIIDLMYRSQELLSEHEINKVRIDLGENPANMIWLWGGGRKPTMPLFSDFYGKTGAVISAVDLIKGIGRIIGLKVLEVQGVTGYYDTNYQGKAQAAIEALKAVDFVFIHIEAADEAGHNQDLRMKITCLERIDKLVVGTLVEALQGTDYRILIAPDHPTPVQKRTHTDEPVPFIMSGAGITARQCPAFSERQAISSNIYFDSGEQLMREFLNPNTAAA